VFAIRRGDSERSDREGRHASGQVSLDDWVRTELNRARRYERPLVVVSATLHGRRELDSLSRELETALRMSDVIGRSGRNTLVAVLTETTGVGARQFLTRLSIDVAEDVARATSVGVASFPEDAVTWLALQSVATAEQESLLSFREEALARRSDLARDLASQVARAPTAANVPAPVAPSLAHNPTVS
jgi:GGDEF domain-containing protein